MSSFPPRYGQIVLIFLAGLFSATADTYQWDGGAGTSNWQTGNNWNPNGTVGAFNLSGSHRLNVNGAQELTYSAAEGTTVYAQGNAIRGLVIGSGGLGSGSMRITGGTFSTAGNTVQSDNYRPLSSAAGRGRFLPSCETPIVSALRDFRVGLFVAALPCPLPPNKVCPAAPVPPRLLEW